MKDNRSESRLVAVKADNLVALKVASLVVQLGIVMAVMLVDAQVV